MSSPDAFPPGSFCWVDLATTDPVAAQAFYCPLLGWETDEPPASAPRYWMLTKDGRQIAGLFMLAPDMAMDDGANPPRWQSYLAVTNADAIAARAAEIGGRVLMPPADVEDAGRMAFVQDPGGASIGLWQARGHVGLQRVNRIGAPCWHELHTRETDASLDFYADLCGWQHRVSDSVPGGQYRLFADASGAKRGGLMPIGDDWEAHGGPVVPNWALYFCVADCNATVQHAQQLGGGLRYPVMELPRIGCFAALTDPQGATFWVIEFAGNHD